MVEQRQVAQNDAAEWLGDWHPLAEQLGSSEGLVALDRRLAGEPLLGYFAQASRRVGQGQLRKLRPLRDLRVVQRYLRAVEAGEALGWHTLVYGLTLAIYSLPLRQGLLGYARQTMRGFIWRAPRSLGLPERACRALLEELCAGLPAAIEALFK